MTKSEGERSMTLRAKRDWMRSPWGETRLEREEKQDFLFEERTKRQGDKEKIH
jgi:hypothetical protein